MFVTVPRQARKGFTLVEVALAVAVGLIIIGGAVLGYNAVKDNAANSNARDRVLSAVSMAEEYAASNAGKYPPAGTSAFTNMWKSKRPDDYNSSPWGGLAGGSYGVNEAAVTVSGVSTSALASTFVSTSITGLYTSTQMPGQAADVMYMQLTPASPWASITAYSTSSVSAIKNYAVGIFDKNGQAWWDVKGGK